MLFLKDQQTMIEKKFLEVLDQAGDKKKEILEGLKNCTQLEQLCMKFLYTSMPLSDLANYPFTLYLSYANHGLYLKEHTSWGESIPEEIFLNYVLSYRVNNENIEDCRPIFYEQLHKRIEGKTMKEAILEVNYWCLEQVTYQSTDDRTAAPLTLLKSAFGRCGEESTFTVTALRSVGIPARQIYAPRWSHCDDNHAWVEVWCDGNWHYLGACEPEPVLDRGWFTAAASRAMLIHSKVFSPWIKDEEVISRNDRIMIVNNLKKYADAKQIHVKVLDPSLEPMDNVTLRLEILNFSEFYPVATIRTNQQGESRITLGLGDIHIHAVKDGKFMNHILDTRKEDQVVLHWEHAIEKEIITEDFNMIAPKDNMNYAVVLTEEQKNYGKERFLVANDKRKIKEKSFYHEENIASLLDKYPFEKETIKDILIDAKGNAKEIETFLDEHGLQNDLEDRVKLLTTLEVKDYTDIAKDRLVEHYNESLTYKNNFPQPIFVKYIMNPRVWYEEITSYRRFILDYLDDSLQKEFKKAPEKIWHYINDNIGEWSELEYNELYTSPVGLLQIKKGSVMSKKILFVAICRTLGIPAKIERKDLSIQYYGTEGFINVEQDNKEDKSSTSLLVIQSDEAIKWLYMQNWSIGKLKEGVYHTLDLASETWVNGKLQVNLQPGHYRIITSNRLPNGNLFGRKYGFILKENETKNLDIELRDVKITDMLEDLDIAEFKLRDEAGNVVMGSDITKKVPKVMVWLEEGKEPTQHILNEMIESKEEFKHIANDIIFVVKDKNSLLNDRLAKTLELLPDIQIYYDDFTENISSIARRIYVDPDKLPLLMITNKPLNVVYGFSGYNVGLGNLILRIVEGL